MVYYKKTKKQKGQGSGKFFSKGPGTPKLKVIVLGGLEEVGRNMTLLEYENDIILIDMGLQFPEEDMPGIDYIIPNISYLKGKEKNIRGIIITHGHYDHIGGIPHLVPRLGNPTIYGTQLTLAIIKKRQEDYKSAKLNLAVVKTEDVITLGKFKLEFIHVNHNIPDSVAVVVHTPVGTVVHTGDWKFDYTPVDERPADFAKIAEVGRQGVLALMSDSTNAPEEGHQISEHEIGKNLKTLIEKAPGRIIIGTFSSLLSRVEQIIRIAEEMGKKVAVDGFSMKTNVEIMRMLGYLKVRQGTLIDIADVHNFPQEKIIIVCTGAQGEERAVLMRIANEEHRFVRIEPKDTVVFSSSVVPGNERTIQRLKDTLYRKGADVVHYKMMDIHAGGHAKAEDIKLMVRLVNPKYFIPIEGSHSHLRLNAKVAESIGFDPKNIFVADNGQVMEFQAASKDSYGATGRLTPQHVPSDYVMVDGLGVGDVSQVVLRDRKMMAEDGMIVIITTIDAKTGYLIGSPDIISRGFVYMRESKELIEQVRAKVKKLISDRDPKSAADNVFIKNKIRDNIGQFLFTKTERRPMVLPVIIEV
ncbi:MAG: ribonuclease J [Patescibacteria group bacterium]